MKTRALIFLSLAANAALAWQFCHRTPAAAAVELRVSPVLPAPTTAPAAPEKLTVNVAETFDWSHLADTDFKKYRDHLRAVGCPDDTVRDILTAEIDDWFLQRRRAALDELQRQFWDKLAADIHSLDNSAMHQLLAKLVAERDRLLADVLGADEKNDDDEELRRTRRMEARYAWLPAETRTRLLALEKDFAARNQALDKEIRERVPQTPETDADKTRRKNLEDELTLARKRLFTPAELAEYELRNSSGARWAANLSGFEPSEMEWRTLAAARRDYDAAFAKKPNDETKRQLDAAWQQQLQATLGTERFAQYQLASDGDLRQTRRITVRYGLPDSLAQETAAMQREAVSASQLVRENSALTPDVRESALRLIQQETRRSLAAKLGAKVFVTYQKYHGDWLKQLNPPSD
ncbi:MAG: hypothetical protein RLZZ350_1781 [Verrucomicrobiota bacterium]|jgi:hypothetical protein